MAALIDATTGYVITDFSSDDTENPFSGTGPGSATGYDVTDFGTDDLENPFTGFQVQGILWDVGAPVTRNVYIKAFEDQTAPRLGFSTSFAYLFLAILTWIVNVASTLSFHSQETKSASRQVMAALAMVGSLAISNVFTKIVNGTLMFAGNIFNQSSKLLSAAVSFVGRLIYPIAFQIMTGSLSFVGTFNRLRGKVFTAILRFRASMGDVWNRIMVSIIIGVADKNQYITTRFINIINTLGITYNEILVTPLPIPLSLFLPNGPLKVFYVFNQDETNSVVIDSGILFNVFPQTILPRKAIFLSPVDPTIYIRCPSGTARITLVASR